MKGQLTKQFEQQELTAKSLWLVTASLVWKKVPTSTWTMELRDLRAWCLFFVALRYL